MSSLTRLGTRLAAMLIVAVLWVAMSEGTQSAEKKPFFKKPYVFGAHRGGAHWRPESTIKTFREAVGLWPDILLETDARLTKDGVVVLLHDDSVDRTTDGTGKIANLTWEEVRALDAGYQFTPDGGKTFPYRGQGYRIPRLEDALKALPNTHFLVEWKDTPGIVKPGVEAIERAGAEDRVLVASFNPKLMAETKRLNPRIARCYSAETRKGLAKALAGDWESYKPVDDVLTVWLSRIEQYGFGAEDFPRIQAKGIPILVYTMNSEKAMLRVLKDLNVDSLLTDRPDVLADVLTDLGRR